MGTFSDVSGTVAADQSGVGTITFTSVANALLSDDVRSTAVLLLGESSHYLAVTGFRFAIPADATVLGITVDVERSTTVATSITDNSLRLLKAGVPAGDNKASGAQWPTSDAYASYGSASDLWGTTWTPAEVNASDFGVGISAVAGVAATAQIDHVKVSVTYAGGSRTGNARRRLRAGGGMSTVERAL